MYDDDELTLQTLAQIQKAGWDRAMTTCCYKY